MMKTSFLLAFALVLGLPAVSMADTFHVAPGGDDAGAGTRVAPFGTPTGCFRAMSPGDTCLFETGTWSGKAPKRYYPRYNACEGPRGSRGAPTVYAAAPGASPVFESFGVSGTDGHGDCHDIEVRGIRTTESFLIWSAEHVRITGNEMSGGMDRDGNWSAVRVEGVDYLQFDHNLVSDLNDCPSCREQALVTVFTTSHSVFEFNTLDATVGVRPQYGAIMLKDSPIEDDVRYNLVIGHQILGSNQNNRVGRDLRIYGNVVIGGSIKSWVRTLDTSIHHNTIVEGALIADGSHSPGLEMVANLVTGTTVNFAMDEDYWEGLDEIHLDYNVYDGDAAYYADRYGPTSRTLHDLPAWRQALQSDGCAGCEANSRELDCYFVPGADTEFHIGGGACATADPDGGEVGAYALTHCVGHECGDAPVVVVDGGAGELPDAGGTGGGGTSDGGVDSMDPMNPADPTDPPPRTASCSMGAGPASPVGAALFLGLMMSYVTVIRRRP